MAQWMGASTDTQRENALIGMREVVQVCGGTRGTRKCFVLGLPSARACADAGRHERIGRKATWQKALPSVNQALVFFQQALWRRSCTNGGGSPGCRRHHQTHLGFYQTPPPVASGTLIKGIPMAETFANDLFAGLPADKAAAR